MATHHHSADCLIELGMEELPPKAMPDLSAAFASLLLKGLESRRLTHGAHRVYAAPRRLALFVEALATEQADEAVVMRGPPVSVAFDADGKPTRAATAFADKAGVAVDALQRERTDKGEWLVHHAVQAGVPAADLLGDVVREALDAMPIPRRMRWGDGETGFIRPLHWLVLLHGEHVASAEILGVTAGNQTRGHRFHHPAPVTITRPADYPSLMNAAYVMADFDERRARVWAQAEAAATSVGGKVLRDEALLDEITALCDWPVAVVGAFDTEYLSLPIEVLESTLKIHQRYFPVVDPSGKPMAHFVTIANIESSDPSAVQRGNQRVVSPRLADAAFFWNNDTRAPLASRHERLADVVYQKTLGTLADKTARVGALCRSICAELGIDDSETARAASLARCDLVTDMVGEFPDLQGVMGGYYAARDGEPEAVVRAISEQYYPRFAGDAIPSNTVGCILSAAERIDTLAGIFAIGKRPSGNRDPFGLRRSALGLLRILIEAPLDIDLRALFRAAVDAQPVDTGKHPELVDDIYDYVTERLRHYYEDSLCRDRRDLFDAVLAREPRSMVDFNARLAAVAAFVKLPEADALAAANKRIANILRGGGVDAYADLDAKALSAPAEQRLLDDWRKAREALVPMLKSRDYTAALTRLSVLRDAVDSFFDDVMVMDENIDLRRNRMALLSEVRGLFLEVADISELTHAASGA